MSKRLLLAALACALALALPSTAAADFESGVAAAEVDSDSARLWTRADSEGRVRLTVARDSRFRRRVERHRLRARERRDNTVQTTVDDLRAGTTYFYRFTREGERSDRGSFTTAPRRRDRGKVTFAYTGDSDPVKDPQSGRHHFGRFPVFDRMRREGNDFNVDLGDVIYSDTDSSLDRVDPLALTLDQKRRKYRDMLEVDSLRDLRADTGIYNHWDDHEFLNDFAIDQTNYPTRSGTQEGQPPRIQTVDGRQVYRDGVKAFREYMPVTYSSRRGIYRTVRWGRNLELFFLDERSFRDVGADDGGVCDNPPGSGQRDFAPTAPQRIRSLFAGVVPALGTPPPPGCVARINDPSRDFLGASQLRDFTRAVDRSTATFKVVMNEMPIQQFYVDPYDRWEGYAAERRRVIEALQQIDNVVFLSTDVHANFVNDVRLATFPEEGGPVNSGIMEFTSGPAGTDTLADDLADETNNPNAGQLANQFFLTRQPPDGPGISCSNVDVFSYGQVEVTRRRMTITLRDENGRPVKGFDGRDCGPYRVDAE